MEKYEKNIGLRSIWLTFLRRLDMILVIFIPVGLAAFVITNFVLTKTYASDVTVAKDSNFRTAQYEAFSTKVKSTDITNVVAENLKNNGKFHANGALISSDEIYTGIIFSTSFTDNTSSQITFSYQNIDKTVTQAVMSELSNYAVTVIKNGGGDFATLRITSEASASYKNSKDTKYFLIALAVDFVVSIAVPFIFEIVEDLVWDKKDIEAWGVEGYDISALKIKEKKEEK